jgi:hypothetical protein
LIPESPGKEKFKGKWKERRRERHRFLRKNMAFYTQDHFCSGLEVLRVSSASILEIAPSPLLPLSSLCLLSGL